MERYRQGRATQHEVAEARPLSRFEVDDLLNRYHVTEDLAPPEEYAADLAAARRAMQHVGRVQPGS